MRIVAGAYRGRPLATPQHAGLRPTSDRVRESVFNILAHAIPDFDIAGLRVLDLFAGTGALGIEAISRGAAFCLFVETDPDARALIRRNVDAFGLAGNTKIFRRDATDLGPISGGPPYGLAFLDPPYSKGLAERAISSALAGGWITPEALVVVEERAGAELALPTGLVEIDRRTWGDTAVLFARVSGGAR
jgi:16S rRNA (guanine966-N2)-methyltransferase